MQNEHDKSQFLRDEYIQQTPEHRMAAVVRSHHSDDIKIQMIAELFAEARRETVSDVYAQNAAFWNDAGKMGPINL